MSARLKLGDALTVPLDIVDNVKRRIKAGSPENDRGCWIWQASTKNGYGQMSVAGRCRYTHTLAYEVFVGPIPPGKEVCHECDVKRCNNPSHFFLGTHLENIADMHHKGRGTKPPVRRGEEHSQAVLTDAQVAEIRWLRSRGVPQRTVAAQFHCSQSTVWRIAHRRVRVEAAS